MYGRTDGVMLFASCMHVAVIVVVDLILLFPRVCQDYPPVFPPRQPRREDGLMQSSPCLGQSSESAPGLRDFWFSCSQNTVGSGA